MSRALLCLCLAMVSATARGSALDPAKYRADPPAEHSQSFGERIEVRLKPLYLRATRRGLAIEGLGPEDFVLSVNRREVPVEAVDWSVFGVPAPLAFEPAKGSPGGVNFASARDLGRLVVFFVQADLRASRSVGHLRLLLEIDPLLDELGPGDRVAVASFDHHLELRLDFTQDRRRIEKALREATLFGEASPTSSNTEPSLATHFDFAAARLAASPERALELTARALAPFAGQKALIYLGFGFGERDRDGMRLRREYEVALEALREAETSVFALDATQAGGHDLAFGMHQVAADTGGTYYSAFEFPKFAVQSVTGILSGYYTIFYRPEAAETDPSRVTVKLRRRDGSIRLLEPRAVNPTLDKLSPCAE